ncbi:uncharacterized protein RSE6_03313 [Rhynchosporium secalis]|uniref:Uncharacterized protein n=1 Tax=Rhynchosporium secalis TaxID=38038 RepID=A0A1E1M2G3_RHYSE|nr:uncharacterized protein RSE6_03313 [Rhynchosporium secalis]
MVHITLPLLGLCVLVSLVAVAPAANIDEIFYLANCSPCIITDKNCRFTRSTIAYYPRESASENGEYPAEILGVPSVIAWEGITVSGTFSTTNLFTAKINSDAKNKKLYEFSGTGSTSRLEYSHPEERWLYVSSLLNGYRFLELLS